MDQQEFARRVLNGKIELESNNTDLDDAIQGILIESEPIYKGAARRIKTVISFNHGAVPIYMRVNGTQVKIGDMDLTYDSFNALHRVMSMYQPKYYIVDGDTQQEFQVNMLMDTATLPRLDDRDYYLG